MEILTNAAVIAAVCLAAFCAGYWCYSRFVAQRIFDIGEDIITPAHELADGRDFVATSKHVLFGHHFTSVAGAAPIIGPAVAVYWGWLPAVLWVVIGTIFVGAVHDFGCLVISAKNRGRSIGDLTGGVISKRARTLFLLLVAALAWIVIAVFAVAIASLFVDYPSSVIPVNFEILIAVVIGWVITRRKMKLLAPSLIALALLYALVFYGAYRPLPSFHLLVGSSETIAAIDRAIAAGEVAESAADAAEQRAELHTWKEKAGVVDPTQPLAIAAHLSASAAAAEAAGDSSRAAALAAAAADVRQARGRAISLWVYFLLLYSLVASLLPVWLLLQPRDFINSHQLIVGLVLLYAGLMLAHPSMGDPATGGAPALNLHPSYIGADHASHTDDTARPWFPFLFVTIACGALSGFHGLVSSGTTSKQLDRLSDARMIGYGAMIGEGALGLLSVLACTAGVALVGSWGGEGGYYNQPAAQFNLPLQIGAFVEGSSGFLAAVGMPAGVGATLVAVMVISFAATTLDSATRIQRYVIQELGEGLGIKPLSWPWLAALLAAGAPIFLVFERRWTHLWPVFGATNQMLGALSLLVLSIYLHRKGKSVWVTLLPFFFVATITAMSLALDFERFRAGGRTLLMWVSGGLFALATWILIEGVVALWRHRRRDQPLTLR